MVDVGRKSLKHFFVSLLCVALWTPLLSFASVDGLSQSLLDSVNQKNYSPASGELRVMNRYDILFDPANRVSDEFSIPSSFLPRVQFWLDIYTKYSIREHVIHHAKYPWIVFSVVDLNPLEQEPLHKWTRYHRGKKMVKAETANVRATLKKLASRKSFKNLNARERAIYNLLASVPGKRHSVIREAAQNVRVQLGQRDYYISGLRNSAPYLPYMEAEMQQAGLPPELARIPLVESSFNQKAESKVGAAGVWQIMPHVGREYLIVGDHIDERLSPLKATVVARELMRRNYRTLQSWPLAVTAYNHGAFSLKRYMREKKTNNLEGLIRKSPFGAFRFASANFYACFLAAAYAERYQSEIFLDASPSATQDLRYQLVVLSKKVRAKKLHEYAKADKETLLDLNPDITRAYKSNAWIPRGFKVFVPL